jgi:hypothetical protein
MATGEKNQFPELLNHKQLGLVTADAVMDGGLQSTEISGPGHFRICLNREEQEIRVAWLPAVDLQKAVSSIQSGKHQREVRRGMVRWF